MSISLVLAAQAGSDTMRIFLFILVLVAVALILTGGGIAVYTLRSQRREQATNADRSFRE